VLLREVKNIFHTELDPLYPKEEVNSFFSILIEHYLNLERFALALQPDLIVSKENETPLFGALSRLKLKEPIQHIIGTSHFMEMDFKVTKDVLIPRPETEELVRWIIEEVHRLESEEQNTKGLRILDIGTGRGCIAISLAKHLNNAKIYALDISEDALKIANENAVLNDVEIIFLEKNILEDELDKEFDIIVSNPPYVRELEKKEMHANVLDYEPSQALFVSNEDPLVFYRRITSIASNQLIKGGYLFFEVNQYLGKETEQLLKDDKFSEIELRKDMFGNDRMLKGKL
jgi:release factor glutamine methyltransferase